MYTKTQDNHFQAGFHLGLYFVSVHLPIPVLLVLISVVLSLRRAGLVVCGL